MQDICCPNSVRSHRVNIFLVVGAELATLVNVARPLHVLFQFLVGYFLAEFNGLLMQYEAFYQACQRGVLITPFEGHFVPVSKVVGGHTGVIARSL